MNNISKTMRINSDFGDRLGTTQWDTLLFAKVVFLDKSNASVKPRLYQLKDSALSNTPPDLLKSTAFSFSHDAFILLGEVENLDKSKKRVELSDKTFVSYTHLVTVSGSKMETSFYDPEFSAGLQTLVDALRVKPIIPNPYQPNPPKVKTKNTAPRASKESKESNDSQIESLVHPYILEATDRAIGSTLASLNKRLYEVQI